MAQEMEICSRLGFADDSSDRLAKQFSDEVEQFAATNSEQGIYRSIDEMTQGYLYDAGAGERICGRYLEGTGRYPFQWPRHHDRYVWKLSWQKLRCTSSRH